jgi:hypothetical protein
METVGGEPLGNGLPDSARSSVEGKTEGSIRTPPKIVLPEKDVAQNAIMSTVATRSPT